MLLKRTFFFLFFLVAATLLKAQTQEPPVAIGSWKAYLPYGGPDVIALAGQKVYAATGLSVFNLNLQDNSLERLHKANGLDDINAIGVYYGKETGTVAISYLNSNMDFIIDGELVNFPYIRTAGISGNKVYDLYLRLEKDVLSRKPDIVVVFVGVNDVWHKRLLGTGTDADKFGSFYEALIVKMREAGIKLVLCTPACIGEKTDCSNAQDGELNQYAQIIRELAVQYKCGLCDLRNEFSNYNASHNPENRDRGILTTDGVHLNDAGNALTARLMLDKIREQ